MKASMPLTHQYLLNIVEEAGGLNEERLAWFYQRYIKSEQVKYTPELASVIKQLHYLGKIEKRGRYWCRPWHEPDYTLLRCLDVMMALADDVLPKFVYKRETKTLTFFLPTGECLSPVCRYCGAGIVCEHVGQRPDDAARPYGFVSVGKFHAAFQVVLQ